MNALISSRILNRKHQRVGVVVAVKDPLTKQVNIGWSLCFSKKDTFDNNLGMTIALGRADHGSTDPVPHSIRGEVNRMIDRAKRYFKDATAIASPK